MIKEIHIRDASTASRLGVETPHVIEFEPGLNIVSGRNGTGKSTLLDALRYATKSGKKNKSKNRLIWDSTVPVKYFNSETATADKSTDTSSSDLAKHGGESFGQRMSRYLATLKSINGEHIILIDEPEVGLDYYATEELGKIILKTLKRNRGVGNNVQIIMITHDTLLMTAPNSNHISLGDDVEYARTILKLLKKRLSKL